MYVYSCVIYNSGSTVIIMSFSFVIDDDLCLVSPEKKKDYYITADSEISMSTTNLSTILQLIVVQHPGSKQ